MRCDAVGTIIGRQRFGCRTSPDLPYLQGSTDNKKKGKVQSVPGKKVNPWDKRSCGWDADKGPGFVDAALWIKHRMRPGTPNSCNAEASDELFHHFRGWPAGSLLRQLSWLDPGPGRGRSRDGMERVRQAVRIFIACFELDHEPGTDAATHVNDVPVKSTGACCIIDHIYPARTWKGLQS
jgi:hypothetical protein